MIQSFRTFEENATALPKLKRGNQRLFFFASLSFLTSVVKHQKQYSVFTSVLVETEYSQYSVSTSVLAETEHKTTNSVER